MDDKTNDRERLNAAPADNDNTGVPSTPHYRMLGESGLYEDEEGNTYSASEIFGQDDSGKAADETKIAIDNSFVSELDDKANPAYWYYYYDPRYCGPSREAYMEEMARRYGYPYQMKKEKAMQTAVAEPTTGKTPHTPEVTKKQDNQQPSEDARKRDDRQPSEGTRKTDDRQPAETAKRKADQDQRMAEREGLRPDYHSYSNGLRSCGMVNRRGEVLISYDEYNHISYFHNGLARVKKKKTGLFGFVDIHGKEVIPCTWKSAGEFSEYMAGVQNDNKKCGFIDVTGHLVIPCIWEDAWPFHNGMAKVQEHSKIGMIDPSGKRVIPCIWKGMGVFSEGLAGVQDEDGKCGYIDRTGMVVIPCRWKNVWTFSEGMAVVQDFNKRLGFIDKSGRLVIPCRWKKAEFFKDGRARVTEGGGLFRKEKWVYIDRQGRVISKKVKK